MFHNLLTKSTAMFRANCGVRNFKKLSRHRKPFKEKKFVHPEFMSPVVDYLERLRLANSFEQLDVVNKERELRESLTTRELEVRGLALRDLSLDLNHFGACSPRGEVEIKLKRDSSIVGGYQWRPGTLITLQYSKFGQDFEELDSWQKIDGMIADIQTFYIVVRFSSFHSLLFEWFSNKGSLEGDIRIIKRSESHIYRSYGKHMEKILNNRIKVDTTTPSGQFFSLLLNDWNPKDKEKEEKVETRNKSQTLIVYNRNIKSDPSKMKALHMAAKCPPLCLIHGPPGTGKTTTLAAAVLSAVANGDKVLVCAPSHSACDAFTLALARHWPVSMDDTFFRLGNALRITSNKVKQYCMENRREYAALNSIAENLDFVRRQLMDRYKGKAEIIQEEENLTNDFSRAAKTLEHEFIKKSSVVITTIFDAKNRRFPKEEFDLVVVDEAGFTPATTLLPVMLRSQRMILAGDHMQLPPVVNTQEAEKLGLGVSIFELIALKSPPKQQQNVTLLTRQFRSNEAICEWSSSYFYENKIISDQKVKDILLTDLVQHKKAFQPGVSKGTSDTENVNPLLDSPFLFVDTSDNDWKEDMEDDDSFCNSDEAVFVSEVVDKFLALGICPDNISVIAPYWAQISLIRSLLWEGSGHNSVEVRTVDGFQGKEKQVVIISMVRSNPQAELGFLKETRRINVSVTRAQRCCVIVGDSSTLKQDPGLASLIQHCQDKSCFVSADQIHSAIFQ